MLLRKKNRGRSAAMLMMFTTACVLPNDEFEPGLIPNQAPVVNLDDADPRWSILLVDIDCPSISLRIPVMDPDDTDLRFRWVVRDDDNTRFSFDEVSPGPTGVERQATNTFALDADEFDDLREQIDNPAGNRTAFITLYITDAPTWSIANPNIEGQGQKTTPGSDSSRDYPRDWNLGAIPPPETTGGVDYSVTTYSWALEFNNRGLPCP